MMNDQDKKTQEFLFDKMLESDHEYGIRYIDSNTCIAFKKAGNRKLTANSDCYEKIKKIVSEEYFNKTFVPLDYGK
jgi:hypothetical protein